MTRRWSNFGYFTPAPKKPPPARGIKVKGLGTTWWGQRWIEALVTVLAGDSARLGRGKTYARAGRVHDLTVQRGTVTAKVTGSGPRPYSIVLTLVALPDAAWRAAIAGMAEQVHFAAELLAGRMPEAIDQVFEAQRVSLFPRSRADLTTKCSCPDWGDPCKHVAATHYVLGEAFDRDPFLLFELRGRTKEQVLDALRVARAGAAPAKQAKNAKADAVPTVKLGRLTAARYEAAPQARPALHFAFEAPATRSAVLLQLGAPAGWSLPGAPAEALAPIVRAAAEAARKLALSEPPAEPPAEPPPGKPRGRRR